jgi:hypothetical protein
MSNVGDALTGGGSSATGVTDTSGGSFGDTPNLTNSDFAGLTDADIMGAGSGPTEFSQASNLANALSSGSPVGSSPVAAQTAAMTPTGTAAATGGDPAGASGGTQSNTTPGSTPPGQNQQQQSGGGGGGQHDPDHAPPSAVAELKALLKGLSGQTTGPTGPVPQGGAAPFALPTLAAGQTGVQSPSNPYPPMAQQVLKAIAGGASPAAASLETGAPGAGFAGSLPGGAADIPAAIPGDAELKFDPATRTYTPQPGMVRTDDQGNPITAAGTRADQTPLPPSRPRQVASLGDDPAGDQTEFGGGAGHDLTVNARKPPQPQPDLPTRVPHPDAALPTHKPGASPAPAPPKGPATSSILNDISGVSTGSPTALADLAQAAQTLLPIVLPLLGGLFGGGGRRGGHFHGGRFTHGFGGGFSGFRGGMNAMRYHGGQHPMARGAWPYHHPQFGWHMHGRPPGPGWLPLHPTDAQGLVGAQPGQQDPNAPDPNAPPKETGRAPGTPDQVGSSGAIPGASAKDVDDYTRQVAQGYGIDPDVASKILAQESSYGQAWGGDKGPDRKPTSFGPFQLHFAADGKAMGDQFRRDTGLDPRDPRTWKQQVDYAMMKASTEGWTPWTTSMKKLGMNQWSGITTNRRYAGRMSNKPLAQETRVTPDMVAKLPPSSQPMVAGP